MVEWMDAEEFCRQQWPGLARPLTAWTRDRALGEEVAQEALARVLARWLRVREMASPGGYAHRVAINLATDELVRRRRQPPFPDRAFTPLSRLHGRGRRGVGDHSLCGALACSRPPF